MIPERIRPYAEVVVTVADGLAHRPAWTRVVTGRQARWSETAGRMVDEPVYGLAWRPACTQEGADPPPKIYQMSAGWAHSRGHRGCPVCWPPQRGQE